ncbi:MAG: FAD-dependent oxidoreductase [Acidimicrobiales bacterium]
MGIDDGDDDGAIDDRGGAPAPAEEVPGSLAEAPVPWLHDALEQAETAALLPAVAALTGDVSVLREDLRVDPILSMMPGAEVPEAQLAEARRAALDALVRFREGGGQPAPPPSPADLRAMLDFVVGGAPVDDYVELFREELHIEGADLRAPAWSLEAIAPDRHVRAVVIGAGMSGLLAAHRLGQAGVDVTVLEKDVDVGGTWLENTYPGCRVDVPNQFYSYSFLQRDDWPQHFSTQEVLLDYFRDAAVTMGVRDRIRFGTEVSSMRWDDGRAVWVVATRDRDGGEGTVEAEVVVSAVGQLNRPKLPDIDGMERFAGPSFHSAHWDHSVGLAGKRVAVIGTGASAMQLIPAIAAEVGHLDVFQRTPAWLIPTEDYHDRVSPQQAWLFRHLPGYAHWYRFWLFWRNAEGMLPLVTVDPDWEPEGESVSALNDLLREFLTQYLREQFGDDPELLAAVTPHYPPASKRVIRDNGIWAATLRRDDVSLVTDPIAEITETGVRTADGTVHEADVIVYGTGFQASRFLTPMQVIGRDGVDLHERWGGDARAYLGVTVPGFPNLFLLYGPNTNIVINGSIIFFSECEVRYLCGLLELLVSGGHRALECRPEVHDAFNAEVDAGNRTMAWGVATVNSWYRNEHGRSAQNWPFTLLDYWQRTRRPNPDDYTWC